MAERAAEERQAQCDKLMMLVAEADGRRDEQAEAAAAAVAEASALRRQLQATREKVDALHEEGLVSKEEVGIESRTDVKVLIAEIRYLEALLFSGASPRGVSRPMANAGSE